MKDEQFSLKSLLILATFVALGVAVVWSMYSARQTQVSLKNEIATLQIQITELEAEANLYKGQGLRTDYAEKMLLHVLANSEQHSELIAALQNGSKRKVGISLHPMEEEDGVTYVNFYAMGTSPGDTPFCFSFLVREEPFEVLDQISGEQSRLPRMQDGEWFCGAGQNGQDVWYRISSEGFEQYQP